MQNRVLIYSKPNIGDGPPPPELRTNSTFMFCIATAQRKYTIGQQKNDQIFSKTASGGYECVATVNLKMHKRERESIRIEGAMCQRHFFQMFP